MALPDGLPSLCMLPGGQALRREGPWLFSMKGFSLVFQVVSSSGVVVPSGGGWFPLCRLLQSDGKWAE